MLGLNVTRSKTQKNNTNTDTTTYIKEIMLIMVLLYKIYYTVGLYTSFKVV